jgi:hypothetical protein
MSKFTVTIENGAYRVEFPYDREAVEMIKRYIPSTGRSFDGPRKCWMIAADQKRNAEIALGMTFPNIGKSAAVKETRLIEVRYIGACKERVPGEISAFGMDKAGRWMYVFPVDTLTGWFDGTVSAEPETMLTLYSVLGARQSATPEEIKTAYRRMAKQWHPDVCREPDANRMFLRIREAYDILSSERQRARYDAGLALEASIQKVPQKDAIFSPAMGVYRSPLRCGYILAEGTQSLARFVVSKILGWDDITNSAGQVLVVSWKMGDEKPTEVWA